MAIDDFGSRWHIHSLHEKHFTNWFETMLKINGSILIRPYTFWKSFRFSKLAGLPNLLYRRRESFFFYVNKSKTYIPSNRKTECCSTTSVRTHELYNSVATSFIFRNFFCLFFCIDSRNGSSRCVFEIIVYRALSKQWKLSEMSFSKGALSCLLLYKRAIIVRHIYTPWKTNRRHSFPRRL